ncbi:hypothetical protein D3C85_1045130 [compost metagenome]
MAACRLCRRAGDCGIGGQLRGHGDRQGRYGSRWLRLFRHGPGDMRGYRQSERPREGCFDSHRGADAGDSAWRADGDHRRPTSGLARGFLAGLRIDRGLRPHSFRAGAQGKAPPGGESWR